MRSLKRALSVFALVAAVVCSFVLPFATSAAPAAAAGTGAGTVISNTASATYQDGSGQAYTTVSNTVTTTVQFAPSLTVTPQAANQTVQPNSTVEDPFTLTNTGNNTGPFALTQDAVLTGGATLKGYVIPGTTCTLAAPCTTYTAANAAITAAGLTSPPGGTLVVNVLYTSPATQPNTITDQLFANITYSPATGPTSGLTAQTSATANATDTDTVSPDARLDLQKAFTAATGTAPATQSFTITGNNGGGFPAYGSFDSLALVTGANDPAETKPGILVTDKIPLFPATATVATNTITVTGATATLAGGLPAGDTVKVLYTTDPTGASGWTETLPTGGHVAFVAAWIQNATATPVAPATTVALLPSAPTASGGAGTVGTPQVTLTITTTQPSGSGSSNPGAFSNIANSVIDGAPDASGVSNLIGPGIPAGTKDSTTTGGATTAPITATTGPLQNTTSPTNGSKTPPGGASNTVTGAAFASQTVENGPVGFASATGSYNGTATISDANDFTAVAAPCTNNGGASVAQTTQTANCTTGTVTVPGTWSNTGNGMDNFTIAVTPPAGYTAQVFLANCTGTQPYTSIAEAACTATGTALTPTTLTSVASLADQNYVVVYTPSGNVTPFTPLNGVVTVKGTGANASDTNTTYNVLVPGGPLEVTKAQTIVSNNCPGTPTSGIPASGVCPGGVVKYTLTYLVAGSTAQTTTVGGVTSPAGTEPAFALFGLEVGATAANPLTITEDGTGTGTAESGQTANNWATNSYGLQAAAVDSLARAAFTYYTGNPQSAATTTFQTPTTGYPYATAPTNGPFSWIGKFTTVLYPGTTGTISFQVQVK